MANTKNVFVMMPFGKTFDWVYDDLIRPPFEDAGHDVVRADDITSQQNIIKSIIIGIYEADIIVADLSGLNANVFYELGIAHAKGTNVVLMSQDLANAPFNLRSYNIIGYEPRGSNFDYAKRRLQEIATDTNGAIAFGSPVSDFWPQRKPSGRPDSKRSDDPADEDTDGDSDDARNQQQQPEKAETEGGSKDSSDEPDEDGPGTLDLAVQIADSSEDGKKILEAISAEIVALGEEARSLTPQVEMLTKRKDARGLTTFFRRYGNFLDDKGSIINDLVVRFRAVWDTSSNAMRTYFFHPDVDKSARKTALKEVRQLSEGGGSAREGVSGFIFVLRGMPNVERRFTRAKRRLVKILEAFVAIIADVAALEERIIHIDRQMAKEKGTTIMLKAEFKREVLKLWQAHKRSSPNADPLLWWTQTMDARPDLTYRRRSNTDLWQVLQGWLK